MEARIDAIHEPTEAPLQSRVWGGLGLTETLIYPGIGGAGFLGAAARGNVKATLTSTPRQGRLDSMDELPLGDAIGWTERRAVSLDPLAQLTAAAALASELREVGEQLVGQFVTRAREEDCSWTDIGAAFGVSRQAAHERFAAPTAPPPVVWPGLGSDAAAAMAAAGEEMRRFRHNYLGTELVLLGLLTTGDSLAATALARLGIGEPAVRDAVTEIVGYGETPEGACHGVAPRLKRALERTHAEAKHANHRLPRSEHLLLGIVTGGGVASEILARQGADEHALREQIADLLPDAPEVAAAIRRGPQRRKRLRRS